MTDPSLAKNYKPAGGPVGAAPVSLPAVAAEPGPGPQTVGTGAEMFLAEARTAVDASYAKATAPLVVEAAVGDLSDPGAMQTLGQAIDQLTIAVIGE